MGFTTPIFLFIFLPICVILYAISEFFERRGARIFAKLRIRDVLLILMSLGFYSWTLFDGGYRFALYIVLVYIMGFCIQRQRDYALCLPLCKKEKGGYTPLREMHVSLGRCALVISAVVILSFLFYYKYLNFSIETVNKIFGKSLPMHNLIAPLGISFITFSAISYLADIYQGKAEAGSLIDCALYLSFFPKVVSGPIVLWRDFGRQIESRQMSAELAVRGVNRICIGFAKKILLADMFGAYIAQMDAALQWGIDAPTAWAAVLLYMLQIYYDFAGYSDIAIGLSNVLGFTFADNFNFPYRSCSIGEFWRRWHISLGAWFREYVYFPLGGSRRGKRRTLLNLAIVFALTGIWHGASWTYILWGAINGVCVLVERLVEDKPLYQRTPKVIKWAVTMFIAMLFWQLFRFQHLSSCVQWFKYALGLIDITGIPATWQYFLDRRILFLLVCGILGATVLGEPALKKAYQKCTAKPIGYLVQEIALIALMAISIVGMINSRYSPFIYFQY